MISLTHVAEAQRILKEIQIQLDAEDLLIEIECDKDYHITANVKLLRDQSASIPIRCIPLKPSSSESATEATKRMILQTLYEAGGVKSLRERLQAMLPAEREPESFTFEGDIVHMTLKGVLIRQSNGEEVWCPKSITDIVGATFIIPMWFAKKKKLLSRKIKDSSSLDEKDTQYEEEDTLDDWN